MVNKFISKKGEDYDLIDKGGKGWRLKKGESMDELKIRAEGLKGGHKDANRQRKDKGKDEKFKDKDEKKHGGKGGK